MYDFSFSINKTLTHLAKGRTILALVFLSLPRLKKFSLHFSFGEERGSKEITYRLDEQRRKFVPDFVSLRYETRTKLYEIKPIKEGKLLFPKATTIPNYLMISDLSSPPPSFPYI